METDINRIKKLAEEREDENWEFRYFLKTCDIPGKKIDAIVHRLYQEISSQIDCNTCGNCCKELKPALDEEDIERFSKGLGIPIEKFKEWYLIESKERGKYEFNRKPCPFLKDNKCLYPDYKPKDCQSYPHLHKDNFVSRLIGVVNNCFVCPIVFNVYEELKDELWHHRRKR